jgi:spermidine synthase
VYSLINSSSPYGGIVTTPSCSGKADLARTAAGKDEDRLHAGEATLGTTVGERGRRWTGFASRALLGAAFALLLLTAVRLVRIVSGPYLAGWTFPVLAFAAGIAAGARLRPKGPGRLLPRFAPFALPILFLVFVRFAESPSGAGPLGETILSLLALATGALLASRSAGAAGGLRGPGAALAPVFLGASAASLAGSHLLVPALGSSGTAAFSALLFAAAAILPGATRPNGSFPEEDAGRGGSARPAGDAAIVGFVLALVFVLIGWGRTLDLLIGPSFRATGLFWTVLLFGLSTGTALARRADRGRCTTAAALSLAFFGIFVLVSIAASSRLPFLFLSLVKGRAGDPAVVFRARAIVLAILVLPGAVAAGAALRGLLQRGGRRAGSRRAPSRAAALAIAIGLAAAGLSGPRLLPAIGIRSLLVAGSALSTILALALIATAPWRLRARLSAGIPILILLVVTLASPPRWKPGLLNTAVFRYARLQEQLDEESFHRTYAVVPSFYEEGSRATVMVAGGPSNRFLSVNGVVEMSDTEHLPVQVLLGHLPLLFRPDTKSVFLAGAGAGVTAGVLLEKEVSDLRVVEPEEARLEAIRRFGRANGEPWGDDRARFEIGDPRPLLARTGDRYDAVICPGGTPWDRNAAPLQTAEFFRLAASRVRPGGVLATSFPLAGVSEEGLRSFLAAFRSASAHVLGFEATALGTVVLLGSDEPFSLRVRDLESAWDDSLVEFGLRQARIRRAPDLAVQTVLDDESIDAFTSGAAPNTDGSGRLELGSEEFAATLTSGRLPALLRAHHADADRFLDFGGLTAEERGAFHLVAARTCWRLGYGPAGLRFAARAFDENPTASAAGAYGHFLKEEGDDLDSAIAVVRSVWERERADPTLIRQIGEYLFLARRYEECDRLMTEAIGAGIEDAWLYVNRGKARLGLRRHEAAREDLLIGKELDRLQDNSGDINYFLGMAEKNLGRTEAALDYMGRAIDRNPLQIYARLEHGENRLLLGAIDRPTFEKEYVVPFNRARAETLFQDAEARLLEPDHADEVERNLQAVINTTPNHYGAYLVLAEFYFREGNPEEEKAVLERMLSQFGKRPEVVSKIEEYLRATGGEKRVRALGGMLR